MSDTVLINNAIRPKRGRSSGRAWGGGRFRRLRLKRLGSTAVDVVVDYVAEVYAEMERGRQAQPVISAYRPRRR